jgi:chromosome partitioning protein
MKIGVMRGRLKEFDLAQVLQVVGIGRQYTGVEVRDDIAIRGTIFVKAGKIVRVEAEGDEGRAALQKLFRRSDGEFLVYRTETPESLPEPLGALSGLVLEAVDWARTPSRPPSFAPSENTAVGLSNPLRSVLASAPAPAPAPARAPLPTSALRASASSAAARSEAPVHAEGAAAGRVVAVVSPKGGCGKTTVALNLALSLARQGRSVVLVDTDVNGDVLSSIDARSRATLGAFDLVLGNGSVDAALLDTVLPNFRILPAVGQRLPPAERLGADHSAAWRSLLAELARRVEIVIVDTPSGMFGVTHQLMAASSHVVGVLQAEQIAARSFQRFSEGIEAVPAAHRPSVAGIVVNMLQMRQDASMSVFQSACQDLPAEWLFDTSIPRHGVFLDSTQAGVPLRHLDEQAPPAIAFLFDNLAGELVSRIQLASAGARRPRQLLA